MLDSEKVQRLRVEHRNRQVRWGFIWALWCAVLWAAWYVPGTAIYSEAPFADMTKEYLLAAMVITLLNAIAVLLAMFLWVGVLGKFGDYVRTVKQVRISRWYLPAGLAGMLAIFGSVLAIAYVGAAFAAVAALLYPIIGALLARVWYNERITPQAAVGIIVVVAGGVIVFAPGIIGELTGAGTGGLLGYVGGALAFIGWGVEGAIAGRALDVSDPDVGLTIRFTAEVALWIIVGVPVASALAGGRFWEVVGLTLANPNNLLLLVLLGLTFGFCYVAWYKSFPLIGVGRGQAIASLYGPLAIVWLFLFKPESPPAIQFVIGAIVAVIGSFVLFTERRDVLEVIRAVPGIHTGAKGG
ncbi:EamA family transporter [Pseudonocardia sp. TRM90224]|uniref:EamA family transporter n=1 Tax=Pseudonocardia sp. TRM90224 TaxID=2812678 RepID=UPI001E4AE5AB|nr:EamA family transporter [Pseudonocardia sp. TRM90224]